MLLIALGVGSVCRSVGHSAVNAKRCSPTAEKEDKCTLYGGSRSWLQDFLFSIEGTCMLVHTVYSSFSHQLMERL
jgi:hypothetical protein